MGLDKTAQGYQEEGVIKLLKDIRDGLTGGNRPNNRRPNNRPNNDDDNDDGGDNDDNDDDGGDNDDNDVDGGDNDNNDMSDLETEEEAAQRIAKKESKTSDNDKVFDVSNKFKNNMEVEMGNLDKMVMDKKNKWSTKLNKLNNDVKKLDNMLKKIMIKKLIQKKN